MLEIRNVHKYFNKGKRNEIHVINGTSLNMETGLVAMLGPSGCGKTTLLNAIGGLDSVKSGDIYIDGQKITTSWGAKRDQMRNLKIGYIFQDYKLVEDMSVFDNVALVLKMIGLKDQEEIKHRVSYVLEKVGMERFQYRLAKNLSGGQRQRVGIARAIVKNPDIILADEPTGNLDSKNSLEIMKMIKAISQTKLVILVTHERELAEFFASRIVEIEDGKVVKDYENVHDQVLNYDIENRFYLKDFEVQDTLENTNGTIHLYNDTKNPVNVDIIVKNGNIYIHTHDYSKLHVIDADSSIELVDDHYKGMDQKEAQEYEFDYSEMINKDYKKKYSAILNPFTLLKQGFVSVLHFSLIKKLMLIGFFLSGMFLMYAASSITASTTVKDSAFIVQNRKHLTIHDTKLTTESLDHYKDIEGVDYVLPGTSLVTVRMPLLDYYQTSQYDACTKLSMVYTSKLDESSLIMGRMPENEYEVVLDLTAVKYIQNNTQEMIMAGITNPEDYLGRTIQFSNLRNFTIVGITNNEDRTIYIDEKFSDDILYYMNQASNYAIGYKGYNYPDLLSRASGFFRYNLVSEFTNLVSGRLPENDYEVLVDISHSEEWKLNKESTLEINGHKLVVVGYYSSSWLNDLYIVSDHTFHILTVSQYEDITIYPTNKSVAYEALRENGEKVVDVYQSAKNNYVSDIQDTVRANIAVSAIMIAISLIEIYLMTRSSFLSRIKEIGIYRAIGVKKTDIYKMFMGEIISITTLLSVPGVLTMAYILQALTKYLGNYFIISPFNIGLTIVLIYAFNLFVGLLPVANTLRKTPAAILSRIDLE